MAALLACGRKQSRRAAACTQAAKETHLEQLKGPPGSLAGMRGHTLLELSVSLQHAEQHEHRSDHVEAAVTDDKGVVCNVLCPINPTAYIACDLAIVRGSKLGKAAGLH